MLYKIIKQKRNGKNYYYRKYRLGDQVITEYLGKADELEDLVEGDQFWGSTIREQKKRKGQAQQVERYLDHRLDYVNEEVTTLANCHFLIAGYHTKKGQWRKIRE
jgi:hypothetical protein